MKTKSLNPAPRRLRARKPRATSAVATKAKRWGGFAPELCGVMTGPSDLSARKGFVRG